MQAEGRKQQHSGQEAQVWEGLGGGRYQRYPAASKSGVLCLSSDVTLLMVNCVTLTRSVLWGPPPLVVRKLLST